MSIFTLLCLCLSFLHFTGLLQGQSSSGKYCCSNFITVTFVVYLYTAVSMLVFFAVRWEVFQVSTVVIFTLLCVHSSTLTLLLAATHRQTYSRYSSVKIDVHSSTLTLLYLRYVCLCVGATGPYYWGRHVVACTEFCHRVFRRYP